MKTNYSNFKPQQNKDPKTEKVVVKVPEEETITDVPEEKVVVNAPCYKTAIVQVKHLNVRDAPSKKAYKLQILNLGYRVTVLNHTEEWSEIQNPLNKKVKAYVMTKHIS